MAQLPIYTVRMFTLMDYVVTNRIKGCLTEADFLVSIGYSPGNMTNLKRGTQKLQAKHYMNAVIIYNVDANFFYNKKHTEMFVSGKKSGALAQLKEAVARVAIELAKK